MLDWSKKKIKAQRQFNAIKFFKIFDGISEIKQNKMKRAKNGLWDYDIFKSYNFLECGLLQSYKIYTCPMRLFDKNQIK